MNIICFQLKPHQKELYFESDVNNKKRGIGEQYSYEIEIMMKYRVVHQSVDNYAPNEKVQNKVEQICVTHADKYNIKNIIRLLK